jgi:hypothetical protein
VRALGRRRGRLLARLRDLLGVEPELSSRQWLRGTKGLASACREAREHALEFEGRFLIVAGGVRELRLQLVVLALGRLDALRDLALAALALGGALEVARGVGRRGDGGVQLDLEFAAVCAGVIERHALGARRHLVRVGEQRLAEPAPLGCALRLGQVAAECFDLARELLRMALDGLAHGFAAFGGGVGRRLDGLGLVAFGHGAPR